MNMPAGQHGLVVKTPPLLPPPSLPTLASHDHHDDQHYYHHLCHQCQGYIQQCLTA